MGTEVEGKPAQPSPPPNLYRATFYDYSNNGPIFVDGSLDRPKRVKVSESGFQPLPSSGEFEAAVKILEKDENFGKAIREQQLQPAPAMPPIIEIESPDGTRERNISVGLTPVEPGARHEIVGVNLVRQSVVRFEERAPQGSVAHNPICGIPYVQQATANQGDAGQVWITVKQGNTVLWKFLAVRPAASSGTRSSVVELRYVDYRGKRALYRAHVPSINVHYDNNACGPYRDWQWQDRKIQANRVDGAPG